MKITMDHARQMNYCSKGIRLFAKRNNLDLRKFCSEGLDEEELLATGDALAIRLVEEANSGVKKEFSNNRI